MGAAIKRCGSCGAEKPIDQFHWKKHKKSKPTARHSVCKECRNARQRIYASKNREHYRHIDAKRNALPKRRKQIRAWVKSNPEKILAEKAVQRAVRSGALVRRPCERCGKHNTHGHHEDYSKPLEVIWLWPSHHRLRHLELSA